MRKLLRYTAFLAIFIMLFLCVTACTSFRTVPSYHTFSFDDIPLSVSYSKNGETWVPLSADTLLFQKRIYSEGYGETVYLSVKNDAEEAVRIWLGVGAGGIAPPVGLLYGYAESGEDIVNYYALGKEGENTFVLPPRGEARLVLSVKTDAETLGAVAPILGVTFYAEKMNFAFDITDKASFVMQKGKDVSAKLPKHIKQIVFSDRAEPRNASLTDFSLAQNGAVVGWEENGAYIISTRVKGQKVIANEYASFLLADLKQLKKADLSMLDTSLTRDFMRFFAGCTSLEEVSLACLDTSSAVRMRSMFNGCESLSAVDIADWNTSSLVDASYMFADTFSLSVLDLSAWDLSHAVRTTAMFQSSGISQVFLPDSLASVGSLFFNHVDGYDFTTWTLPSSLLSVGKAHCFYNFGSDVFSAFLVEQEDHVAKSLDGVLYSADGTVLLALPKGKTFDDGIFEIAEGVTLLGELSFSRNPHVKTVLLPNSYQVKIYKEKHHADFADENGTGNLNVGNSLNLAIYIYTAVEAYAVKEDHPHYVAVDGVLYTKGTDESAQALVAVPVHLKGDIIIPEGVKRIEEEAFWEDKDVPFRGVSSIHIPASLTEIAENQLAKINSLAATLSVAEENPIYTVQDGKIVLK